MADALGLRCGWVVVARGLDRAEVRYEVRQREVLGAGDDAAALADLAHFIAAHPQVLRSRARGIVVVLQSCLHVCVGAHGLDYVYSCIVCTHYGNSCVYQFMATLRRVTRKPTTLMTTLSAYVNQHRRPHVLTLSPR